MTVAAILVVGCLMLLIQHSFVAMYFDDYGNASLSYGYTSDVQGTAWSFGDLMEWVTWCYNNWGGRILYAAAILIPLLKNGITLYMLLQACVITAIIFVLYKIVCMVNKQEENFKVLVLFFVCYGLIGQDIHKQGTFWASASVLYVWPLLPLFLSVLLYFYLVKNIDGITGKKQFVYMVAEMILVILATFSQEQVGLSMVVFFVLVSLFTYQDRKKYLKINVPILVTSVITYLFLFFAPGNTVRMETTSFSGMGVFARIAYNYHAVVEGFFFDGFKYFNILLGIVCLFMSAFIAKKNKVYSLMFFTSVLQTVYSIFLFKVGYASSTVTDLLMSACMLNIIVVTGLYYWATERMMVYALVLAAGASVVCLLYSPSIYARSYIEYIYVVFFVIGLTLDDFECTFAKARWHILATVLLVAFGFGSAKNYIGITRGYYNNYFYNKYNESILRNYKGENIIYLVKLPNTYYTAEMPYNAGYEFIDYWIKEYYDIPQSTSIVWGDTLTVPTEIEFCDNFEDGWLTGNGKMIVNHYGSGDLLISAYFPEESADLKLTIRVESETATYELNSINNEVSIPINSDGKVVIDVTCEDSDDSLSESEEIKKICKLVFASQK